MFPDPKEISKIGNGSLFIMSKPAGFENLSEDMDHLKRQGITSIVSLLESSEACELGLSQEELSATSLGINYLNVPIKDRSVPKDVSMFTSAIHEAHSQIVEGHNLVAHCRAGIGRSGIFTAMILIHAGYAVAEAFELVSSARGISVPDTEEQIEWVHSHADSVAP